MMILFETMEVSHDKQFERKFSQDKFEKYSVEDVKWLVACSWHESRGARFVLKEDAVEYHKAYFIRATSDKNIFR